MGHYWSNFVTGGSPLRPPADGAWPEWPRFGAAPGEGSTAAATPSGERFLAFEAARTGDGRVHDHGYGEMCAAWEAYAASGEQQRARYIAFGYLC